MAEFRTSDGVRLHYDRSADGEPLVLVHGSATTHRCFDLVVDMLARSFSVIRYDRRGHGASTDGDTWSFRREVDDLLELADHVADGSGICALGYSFGAVIALEATRATGSPIHALVAYEPPFGVPGMVESAPQLLALLEEERRDEAARLFVEETFHLDGGLVDAMARHPMWQITLDVLPNLRRELPVVVASGTPAPLAAFPATRVLVAESGGNPAFHDIAAALADAVGSHTVRVPGIPHFAMTTAPEPFANAVLDHLSTAHRPAGTC